MVTFSVTETQVGHKLMLKYASMLNAITFLIINIYGCHLISNEAYYNTT